MASRVQILTSRRLRCCTIPIFPHSLHVTQMARSGRPNYAKQSQFPDGPVNANRCSPKGLGEKDAQDVCVKTKPISTRSLKFQAGSFKWTALPFKRLMVSLPTGAVVQNKANLPEAESMLTGVRKESYERKRRTMGVRKQSQFPGRRCLAALAMTWCRAGTHEPRSSRGRAP